MVRNHAPKRVVLGIINKDGCMGEYITLPVGNLHQIPEELTDQEACFTEPLAAACRIAEQQVRKTSKLATTSLCMDMRYKDALDVRTMQLGISHCALLQWHLSITTT